MKISPYPLLSFTTLPSIMLMTISLGSPYNSPSWNLFSLPLIIMPQLLKMVTSKIVFCLSCYSSGLWMCLLLFHFLSSLICDSFILFPDIPFLIYILIPVYLFSLLSWGFAKLIGHSLLFIM